VTGQELTVAKLPTKRSSDKRGAILVTGAAGAIGKATAEFLHQSESWPKLLIVDHPSTEKRLNQIATDLSGAIDMLPLDLTQPDASEILVKEGVRLGGWERIIHAAGITSDKTLRNMEYSSSWWPVMQVNLEAAMNIDQAILNSPGALFEDGESGASFVYFSSISGISGNYGQSNYAASKSGLLGYAVAMGHKYPAHSFRVVSPGFIATPMTAKMPFSLER
jgi:3-oxoacyl-[acyl-carrier protein] reductase